ncbi:MAG TPA: TauD/TfdA family dioxygenase [Pirellulales bacterium]|jgi:alpha-ketoglutarate-dependent taurine dioxygenase|nr:TauD/TfdA family dioxygenase [Pirellulales bacterium]
MSSATRQPSVVPCVVAGQQNHAGGVFPLAYECRDAPVDVEAVCAWAGARAGQLSDEACRHGAILFRGFPLRTAADFDRFVAAFGLPAFTYEDSLSNAVRLNRTPRVFTANEAPPTVEIFFHHEMAQTPLYPSKLFFFCEQPAETGGATPLCRSDILWRRLASERPQFAHDVETKGLRYSNVMPGEMDLASGMGRSWQSTLRTTTIEGAEERLRKLGYTWQWLAGDGLRVRTPVMRGVYELPDGRRSFFNQLIAAYCGWKDARNDPSKSITLGDDSPLDSDAVAVAVRLAEELAFDVPWRAGDVALVDNFVTMHGRRPFTGTRKILAAMV